MKMIQSIKLFQKDRKQIINLIFIYLLFTLLLGKITSFAIAHAAPIVKDMGTISVSVVAPPTGVKSLDETTVDIDVKSVGVEEIEVASKTFQIIRLRGCAHTEDVGLPQLPRLVRTIAIPDDAKRVEATVIESQYDLVSGYTVYPAQRPQTDLSGPPPFEIDESAYERDVFYPGQIVRVGNIARWRDITIVQVEIFPIHYNPFKKELRIYNHLKISFKSIKREGTLATQGETGPKVVSSKFKALYEDLILNSNALDLRVGEPQPKESIQPQGLNFDFDPIPIVIQGIPYDHSVKLLSIRHGDHTNFSTLRPLLEWHRASGVPYVSVVKYGTVTAEDIKNTIKSYYNSHPELEYVLLVGDLEYLPWNSNWGGTLPDDDLPGDYWYACLTGGDDPDLWPEVAVGRLPVKNDQELATVVQKILKYSKDPPTTGWLDKVLLVAHKQNAPGKYQGCKEDIRTATYDDPFTFITAYGASTANGGDAATNADVNSAIENGVGIVNYRGHGAFGYPNPRPWGQFWGAQSGDDPSPWNVSGEEYWTSDALSLNNGDMTPVVFSIACMTSALDNPVYDCLGEAFFMQDQGAVAFLGASRPSYTTENHDFDKNLFDAIGNEHIHEIGWILNDADSDLLGLYGLGSSARHNVKIYYWMGDPAMKIWTKGPFTFSHVSYPNEVSTGVLPVKVGFYIYVPGQGFRFIGIQGALVTIDGCGVYTHETTNSTGQVTFNFIPSRNGTMKLTVTKDNYLPYEGSVEIVPLENAITDIEFDPPSPSSLCNGDLVTATFNYTTTDPNGIRIFVRPFTNGHLTPHYGAHGSGLWPYPSGTGSGWFTITEGDVVVDAVRFEIYNGDQSEKLLELFEPVDFTFGHKVLDITPSPSGPRTLKWGERVVASFNYFSCTDNVLIFVRPYTNGAPTLGYSADPSPYYSKGRGNGENGFTIHYGEVDVDELRVTMYDSAYNLLYEEFVPVSYHFEGYPEISLSPSSFNLILGRDMIFTDTLNIENLGHGPLHYALRAREMSSGGFRALKGEFLSGNITRFAPTYDYPVSDQKISGDSLNEKDVSNGTEEDTGLDQSDFKDLTGVSIAYDLSHNEINPTGFDTIKGDLESRGANIVYINSGPITLDLLMPFDVLWINDDWTGTITWSEGEREAVREFVAMGGGLMLHGDEIGAGQTVAAIFGIQYEHGGSSGYTRYIQPHPITDGVTYLYLPGPQAHLTLTQGGTVVVYDKDQVPSVAVVEYGRGRVVAMSDEYFWGPYLQWAENRRFANQSFDWLVPGDLAWLALSKRTGEIPTGSPGDAIYMKFVTKGLQCGDFYGDISVANDDPDENPSRIPVHISVRELADYNTSEYVDGLDLHQFIMFWNLMDIKADLNLDGYVSKIDVVTFARKFGRSSCQ